MRGFKGDGLDIWKELNEWGYDIMFSEQTKSMKLLRIADKYIKNGMEIIFIG
jgi:hypothetical protein